MLRLLQGRRLPKLYVPSASEIPKNGEVDERFKSHAWKACLGL